MFQTTGFRQRTVEVALSVAGALFATSTTALPEHPSAKQQPLWTVERLGRLAEDAVIFAPRSVHSPKNCNDHRRPKSPPHGAGRAGP